MYMTKEEVVNKQFPLFLFWQVGFNFKIGVFMCER